MFGDPTVNQNQDKTAEKICNDEKLDTAEINTQKISDNAIIQIDQEKQTIQSNKIQDDKYASYQDAKQTENPDIQNDYITPNPIDTDSALANSQKEEKSFFTIQKSNKDYQNAWKNKIQKTSSQNNKPELDQRAIQFKMQEEQLLQQRQKQYNLELQQIDDFFISGLQLQESSMSKQKSSKEQDNSQQSWMNKQNAQAMDRWKDVDLFNIEDDEDDPSNEGKQESFAHQKENQYLEVKQDLQNQTMLNIESKEFHKQSDKAKDSCLNLADAYKVLCDIDQQAQMNEMITLQKQYDEDYGQEVQEQFQQEKNGSAYDQNYKKSQKQSQKTQKQNTIDNELHQQFSAHNQKIFDKESQYKQINNNSLSSSHQHNNNISNQNQNAQRHQKTNRNQNSNQYVEQKSSGNPIDHFENDLSRNFPMRPREKELRYQILSQFQDYIVQFYMKKDSQQINQNHQITGLKKEDYNFFLTFVENLQYFMNQQIKELAQMRNYFRNEQVITKILTEYPVLKEDILIYIMKKLQDPILCYDLVCIAFKDFYVPDILENSQNSKIDNCKGQKNHSGKHYSQGQIRNQQSQQNNNNIQNYQQQNLSNTQNHYGQSYANSNLNHSQSNSQYYGQQQNYQRDYYNNNQGSNRQSHLQNDHNIIDQSQLVDQSEKSYDHHIFFNKALINLFKKRIVPRKDNNVIQTIYARNQNHLQELFDQRRQIKEQIFYSQMNNDQELTNKLSAILYGHEENLNKERQRTQLEIFNYLNNDVNLMNEIIDLHGMRAQEAKLIMIRRLRQIQYDLNSGKINNNVDQQNHIVRIICGRGSHSNGTPVLKQQCPESLNYFGYEFHLDFHDGVILVRFRTQKNKMGKETPQQKR
ncbi:UNKNOWN [Stylonychia lemnae]|uniref:Smr domain-containing protein n=1 Tax=Stylonychia lemnae TaxID=5949 RepID=A0A077ZRL4_STYLE|nr:UNKNOWN [Stylonychia lemnae]|eukprot:CDW71146.1 UNKNOWN [Stylonychia lemnae]